MGEERRTTVRAVSGVTVYDNTITSSTTSRSTMFGAKDDTVSENAERTNIFPNTCKLCDSSYLPKLGGTIWKYCAQ